MRKRLSALLLICVMLPMAYGVELIKNGKPRAEIVISKQASPSAKLAASELRRYLKKMSGAELPIVTKPTGQTPIYVGRSEYTDKLGIRLGDIKNDGFKRVATDDYLALLGVDYCRPPIPLGNTRGFSHNSGSPEHPLNKQWMDYTCHKWRYPRNVRDPRNFIRESDYRIHLQDATGSLHAVYDFLEELGMRWFMPLEGIGQVIPELHDIVVPSQSIKKEPDLASRQMIIFGIKPSEFRWLKWLGAGGVFDQWPVHSSTLVTRLQQDRPELFARVGGKTVSCGSDASLPRLASPELRSELTGYLVKFHDAFPEVPYLSIGQPDGWLVMDDRDAAAGWNKKEEGDWGRFSDYMWDFVLDVAQRTRSRRPGVKFSTFSYGYAIKPPKLVDKIPADIAITLVQPVSRIDFDKQLKIREQWIEKAPESDFFLYDNWLNNVPGQPPIPDIFTTQLRSNFKAMEGQFKGVYVALPYGSGPTRLGRPWLTHLMAYLYNKYTWNKNLDLEATLNDYYDKFFGPAKDEMREFYQFAESVWMRSEPRQITAFSGFLKPADVDKYFEILQRAKAKAGNTIYGQRVDAIVQEMEPLKTLFRELKRTGPYVRTRRMSITPPVDGDLTKSFWTEHHPREWSWLRDVKTGASLKEKTRVAFRWLPDRSLLVGIECFDKKMNSLQANTQNTVRDDQGIYNDDNIEVHLETPDGRNVVVVVNPNGAILDRCSNPDDVAFVPLAWNVDSAAVRKLSDRWTAEIKIKDLGGMPTKSFPWGVNVFRQRLAGGKFEGQALSPTGGGFMNAPEKMANLYERP